jgi:hypothetical protein
MRKKSLGPKRKPRAESASHSLTVRFAPEDWKIVQEAAKAQNVSASLFVTSGALILARPERLGALILSPFQEKTVLFPKKDS